MPSVGILNQAQTRWMRHTWTATAHLDGVALLTDSAKTTIRPNLSLAAAGTLTETVWNRAVASETLAGNAASSLTPHDTMNPSVSLLASAILHASVFGYLAARVVLSGSGTTAFSSKAAFKSSETLSGSAAITTSGKVGFDSHEDEIFLDATGRITTSAKEVIRATVSLTGAAAITFVGGDVYNLSLSLSALAAIAETVKNQAKATESLAANATTSIIPGNVMHSSSFLLGTGIFHAYVFGYLLGLSALGGAAAISEDTQANMVAKSTITGTAALTSDGRAGGDTFNITISLKTSAGITCTMRRMVETDIGVVFSEGAGVPPLLRGPGKE